MWRASREDQGQPTSPKAPRIPFACRSILIAAFGLAAASGHAADLGDWFKLEGFGSLAAHAADDTVASMHADPRNPNGSRDGRWRFDGDSLASLQLTLNPDGDLRVVTQWLAKDDLAQRFRPRTEWLYASWDAAPGWNTKLGRLVLPVFMLSDTRNVAFAQTNVRPPSVLYSLNPISHLDGGSLTWRGPAWGGHAELEGTAGRTRVTVALGELDASHIGSLSGRWSSGNGTTWRLGHSRYKADLHAPTLEQALNTLAGGSTGCSNCVAVIADRAPLRFSGSISSIGATHESGRWQLQAEYAYRNSQTVLIAKASAWYAMAAYRWNRWTPYLLLGALRTHDRPLGLGTAAGATPAAAAANAAFERFLLARSDRNTVQLGLRWDLRENLAVKVQLEHARLTRDPVYGSTAALFFPAPPPVGTYPGPAFDGRLNALSLNVDFIF